MLQELPAYQDVVASQIRYQEGKVNLAAINGKGKEKCQCDRFSRFAVIAGGDDRLRKFEERNSKEFAEFVG